MIILSNCGCCLIVFIYILSKIILITHLYHYKPEVYHIYPYPSSAWYYHWYYIHSYYNYQTCHRWRCHHSPDSWAWWDNYYHEYHVDYHVDYHMVYHCLHRAIILNTCRGTRSTTITDGFTKKISENIIFYNFSP